MVTTRKRGRMNTLISSVYPQMQDKVRSLILKHKAKHKTSFYNLALDFGTSEYTLTRFINGGNIKPETFERILNVLNR